MVKILDTTLREGEQTPGVYFDSHIKRAIAEKLDQLGVDIVEAGHPAVSVDIKDLVAQISSLGTKAKIGAHARSIKSDVDLALSCGVQFLGIFYCVSDERLAHKDLNITQAVFNISNTILFSCAFFEAANFVYAFIHLQNQFFRRLHTYPLLKI